MFPNAPIDPSHLPVVAVTAIAIILILFRETRDALQTIDLHSREHEGIKYPTFNSQPPPTTTSSVVQATQFQGAQDIHINGNPTFSNNAVNLGVNNENTTNNNSIVQVDNSGQNNYNVEIGTQYGNTNVGDGQHNGGGIYNGKLLT